MALLDKCIGRPKKTENGCQAIFILPGALLSSLTRSDITVPALGRACDGL